ncbi:polyprenyl diphosphate synthase [Halobaculum magnesiiphilum]|uniref:Tritrans,polycis-undecaprenyl-diphosphate synthase (geranylgeranyl-diphosphate specific) n=1 Tax=Halobaculum magnesiiphilum TaxID=1017351 RepID=A0A8T8WGT0_9EURY|nr:polyprenyl diphosphate synthase [Halobaculum magnesiiphilum]QZP39045.1 di-trans,poly-cis-decaprenylcistransferase [Halobaculum magnesiiphilum]
MRSRLATLFDSTYERVLRREIGEGPDHVAIIQDGNRRYARSRGDDAHDGYHAGADTTERVLDWCADLGIEELTLYAFSTENFDRPAEQRETLFDLLEDKLREFADADRVHEQGVCIRALGDVERLPSRVRDAVEYAEGRTAGYDEFTLNIALAYGGRNELLGAVRAVARDVADGDLAADDVGVAEVESRLYRRPVRDVDLIIRTGGDERTSNFLPWHANGNEAAAYFCSPYWPEFSKVDFLRSIRTYEAREESWRRTRAKRAAALVRSLAAVELDEARTVAGRLRERLPGEATDEELTEALEVDGAGTRETAD